jgi:hypothetical protein
MLSDYIVLTDNMLSDYKMLFVEEDYLQDNKLSFFLETSGFMLSKR